MSGCNKDSSVPQPCVTGCGYNGTAENLSMCPQCYRAHQQRENSHAKLHSKDAEEASSTKKVEPVGLGEKRREGQTKESSGGKLEDLRKRRRGESSAQDQPKLKKKSDSLSSRCMSCRKKIGLTPFKCRCGYYYCLEHRYAETHNCEFDYKSLHKGIIAKENPCVRAVKVQKI